MRRFRPGFRTALIAGTTVGVVLMVVFHHTLTRPLWLDEQWRAYNVSFPVRFFTQRLGANAPVAFGWLLIEKPFALIRNDQLVLRLPMALSLIAMQVATFALLRRRVHSLAALLVSIALMLMTDSIVFAFQLKPFTFEAAVSVAVVLLWLRVREDSLSDWPGYLGLGAACVFATPAVFLVGPLLIYDAIGRFRERAIRQLLPIAVAGGIALLHLTLFLMRQPGINAPRFWDANFAPSRLAAVPSFVVHQLGGWIPGVLRAGRFPGWALPVLQLSGLAFVIAGIVVLAREERGRGLVVAFVSAFALQLLASRLHRWPFGYVRVNFFLVPLVCFFAVAGGAALWRRVAATPARVLLAAVAIGLVAIAATEVGVAATNEPRSREGEAMQSTVALVGKEAGRTDLVLLIGSGSYKAWRYYVDAYEGYPLGTGRGVPDDRIVYMPRTLRAEAMAFLSTHPAAAALWVLKGPPLGESTPFDADAAGVRASGFCPDASMHYPGTGELLRFERCTMRGRDT